MTQITCSRPMRRACAGRHQERIGRFGERIVAAATRDATEPRWLSYCVNPAPLGGSWGASPGSLRMVVRGPVVTAQICTLGVRRGSEADSRADKFAVAKVRIVVEALASAHPSTGGPRNPHGKCASELRLANPDSRAAGSRRKFRDRNVADQGLTRRIDPISPPPQDHTETASEAGTGRDSEAMRFGLFGGADAPRSQGRRPGPRLS